MRRPSNKPCRRSTQAGSVSAFSASRPKGHDLAEVPPDLDQDFSAVREALVQLLQTTAQLGYYPGFVGRTPSRPSRILQAGPQGDLDRIYARLIPEAPAVKQAEAKVLQAERSGPGRAEPPLLRHRQRDRRRGDPAATSTPATTSRWGKA